MTHQKKLVALRLKPSTIEKLKQYADEKEESLSEYIRKVIEFHILSK